MKYDVAIIGGGPAGYTAAERAAQGGLSTILFEKMKQGRLAQLVQSVCLTSRGSAVRIRQRPPHFSLSAILHFARALSSAGSERLPYKQRVGGSNPSAPTIY